MKMFESIRYSKLPLSKYNDWQGHGETRLTVSGEKTRYLLPTVVTLLNLSLWLYYWIIYPWYLPVQVHSSGYSPIDAQLQGHFINKQVPGTLFPTVNSSWVRSSDAESEAIWDSYDPWRLVALTHDDVVKLGKDPANVVKVPWLEDAYAGSMDVTHKLHCLNELRKAAVSDHPSASGLTRVHLLHCVDVLHFDITCHADTDIITFNWADTQVSAYPDFKLNRKCRNWDELVDWSEKNTLSLDKWASTPRPQNVNLVPLDDGYYEMFGFGGSVLYPNGVGWKKNA